MGIDFSSSVDGSSRSGKTLEGLSIWTRSSFFVVEREISTRPCSSQISFLYVRATAVEKTTGYNQGKALHLPHVHSQFENQYSCDISGSSALRRSDWYGRRQESVEIGDAFNEAENDLAFVAEVRESAGIQKSRLRRGLPEAYMHYVKHEAIRQF